MRRAVTVSVLTLVGLGLGGTTKASSMGWTGDEEELSLSLPGGFGASQLALSASGELRMADRVTVEQTESGTGVAANTGAFTTSVGVEAEVRDVISRGAIDVRDRAKIRGVARSEHAVFLGNDTDVLQVEPWTALGSDQQLVWTVQAILPIQEEIHIEPQDPKRELDPGTYGNADVKGELQLRAGEYYFSSLRLESQGSLSYDDAGGPVAVYVAGDVTIRGSVTDIDGGYHDFLVATKTANTSFVESAFYGTMAVPNGRVVVGASGATHEGAFFGKDVEVYPDVTVRHVPFAWDHLLDPGTPVGCADVVLRPTPTGSEKPYGLAETTNPTVAVDAFYVPEARRTRITVEPCSGGPRLMREFRRWSSFWVLGMHEATWSKVDWSAEGSAATWDWTASGCLRISALALTADGEVAGASTATVMRGSNTVSGTVALPEDLATQMSRVRVRIQVGDAWEVTHPNMEGEFALTYLPPGLLHTVRAELWLPDGSPPLRDRVHPLVDLGSGTNAEVELSLIPTIRAIDAYEPDDDVATVARDPVVLGTTEMHVLPTPEDSDVIPLTAIAGRQYRVQVKPTGIRQADLQVALKTESGQLLAGANLVAEDFQIEPDFNWIAQSDGTVFVFVTRSDDEADAAEYTIAVEEVTL